MAAAPKTGAMRKPSVAHESVPGWFPLTISRYVQTSCPSPHEPAKSANSTQKRRRRPEVLVAAQMQAGTATSNGANAWAASSRSRVATGPPGRITTKATKATQATSVASSARRARDRARSHVTGARSPTGQGDRPTGIVVPPAPGTHVMFPGPEPASPGASNSLPYPDHRHQDDAT